MITVADLPKLVTREEWKGPIPFLYCSICDHESSANAGDYWHLPDDHEFWHCHFPMELVTRGVRYVPWSKEEQSK